LRDDVHGSTDEEQRNYSYSGTVSESVEDGADVSDAQTPKSINRPTATALRLMDCTREVIERHRIDDDITAATGHRCRCGAKELSDHSRHVAHEIVARLGLQPESAIDVKGKIRYVSAWFDDELTKLEGTE
jgi:hypothetical protein